MDESRCGFCHTGEENSSICGRLHKDKSDGKVICAHHKCMQYSALLVQYKSEHFGGFMKNEVAKEMRRGGKLTCSICKGDKKRKNKKGATSGCALASCRKSFHYLCVSLDSKTVAKRYHVDIGGKLRVLYRVFCCVKHEAQYKKNLSADDILGRKSDDDDDDDDDQKDDDSNDDSSHTDDNYPQRSTDHHLDSDTDMEPPKKMLKKTTTKSSSPASTGTESSASETKHPPPTEQPSKKGGENKSNDDSEVTDDYCTSNGPEVSEESDSKEQNQTGPDARHIIVIPSKVEDPDLKSVCKKAKIAEDSCLLWPKPYLKTGLPDKCLPYFMWNIAMQIRQCDDKDFVNLEKVFADISVTEYTTLQLFHAHSNSTDEIQVQILSLCDYVNCKYESEKCRLVKLHDDLFYLFVFLPKPLLCIPGLWSVLHTYRWSSHTVVPHLQPTTDKRFSEKKIMLEWLLPQLRNKTVHLTSYPIENTLRLPKAPKHSTVAREIEFKLETMSQVAHTNTPTKVLVLSKLNRAIVQFRPYLEKLLEVFLQENHEFECFCVIEMLPTDGICSLEDVLSDYLMEEHRITVYTAFPPSDRLCSCLVLHTTINNPQTESLSANHHVDNRGDHEEASLYLDVDGTPVF